MADVLVSTFGGHGTRTEGGHKHAMQAIQLLASRYDRFDDTIDLFFDLVERFCTINRTRSALLSDSGFDAPSFTSRMMQNYDQKLVKLLSKRRSMTGTKGNWDLIQPLERIKALRLVYETHHVPQLLFPCLGPRNRRTSNLFCESQKMLRTMQKRRLTDVLSTTFSHDRWRTQLSRMSKVSIGSRHTLSESERSSSEEIVQEMGEARQTIDKMDAEIVYLKGQIQILCATAEKSDHYIVAQQDPRTSWLATSDSSSISDTPASPASDTITASTVDLELGDDARRSVCHAL